MAEIKWMALTEAHQLEEIIEHSASNPCIIFKHSSRCSISSLAQNRLESKWAFSEKEILPYFLDLISYRALSNAVAEQFGVRHESPQILLIQNGICTYQASHLDISARELKAALSQSA